MEPCRYFGMPGGCVRGEKCFFAHAGEELAQTRVAAGGLKVESAITNGVAITTRLAKRVSEDSSKKVFVGGLPTSVESEDLRELFEEKFGPVMDAIVIGSHSGDHVQSRGFGFVTFQHESSVSAAVQAHYMSIIGKKVEIKSAVPRTVIFPADGGLSGSELSGNRSQLEDTKLMDISLASLLGQTIHASEECLIEATSCSQKRGSAACLSIQCALHSESSVAKCGASASQSISTKSLHKVSPAWVTKFKQWLPKFLNEVSSRLKEGEWYPLSSLKGDFRATCGLELDHVALGYHKLSDLIRSMSELCRMKIVPVGRGPATHMVLLPLSPRTPASNAQSQPSCQLLCRSLVDAGRSYAAAASSGKASANSPTVPTAIGSHRCSSVIHGKIGSENGLTCETRDSDFDDGSTLITSIPSSSTYQAFFRQQHRGTSEHEKDSGCFTEMLSVLHPIERHQDEGTARNYFTTGKSSNSGQITAGQDLISLPRLIDTEEMSKGLYVGMLGPSTTTLGVPSLTSFTPREESSYSMWGQKVQSSTVEQESPQSVLPSSYEVFSPHSSQISSSCALPLIGSSQPETKIAELCPQCHQQQALWVAVPCRHRAVCLVCKDKLGLAKLNDTRCLICWGYVDRWIALH